MMLVVLPNRAAAILEFVRSFTVYVEGVGHVCSLALFDFERHGDVRYGAPVNGPPEMRSRDGKMEKSYVNFRAQHPSWRDLRATHGAGLLANIGVAEPAAADATPDSPTTDEALAAHAAAATGAAAPPPAASANANACLLYTSPSPRDS